VSDLETVTRSESRRARHAARRILWAESSLPRVRACGTAGVGEGGAVTVRASGAGVERRGGIGDLAVCGRVWVCPVCSWKIANERQAELSAAIDKWESLGGQVVMVMLTMRHSKAQPLKLLWDGLSKGWAAATSGRAWVAEQEAYGIAGWVRVVEATHGVNGWHVHVHALLFVDQAVTLAGGSVLNVGPLMFQRWRKALMGHGLASPSAANGGLGIKVATAKSAAMLGRYLNKHTYNSDSAAWEIAGGSGKKAMGDHRAPFEILRDVVELGDADDLDLWHEWEQGSQGRRQMTWSKGIRAELLAGRELSDEEIAEAATLQGDVVATIPRQVWWEVWMWQSARLVDAVEADDDGKILLRLLEKGPGGKWQKRWLEATQRAARAAEWESSSLTRRAAS
jgi:Replication protein